MSVTLVKKLTVKTLLVTKRPVKDGPAVHVGRLVGEANGSTRSVPTQYGTTIEFGGSFAGVSLVTDPETGEQIERTVKSNKLFLPGVGEALLAEAIAGGQSARFAFDAFVRYRKVGDADGYEYELRSLFEPAKGDVLTSVLAGLPALPGQRVAKQLTLVAPDAEVPVVTTQEEMPVATTQEEAPAQPAAAEAPKAKQRK